MSALPPDPLWYKDAVIYQLHVKAFFDSNGDGVGDFRGLTTKLDYLKDLGITALWLLPFYPSPLRDDGYDIADYRGIHPSYGTMPDFRIFVREAHKRGLRVVTELVINHTSDQHPWFQRARRAPPGSNWRNYYVWSDTDERFKGTRIIFCDTEKSNWCWDAVAKAYYWHRFYSHQPDLNFDHPAVIREVIRIMRYWLDAGVDGLRLDAVPYLVEREGTINENLPETHAVLRRLRAEVDAAYPDKMLLAEANQWPEDVLPYFGAGDECHMAFHFPLMPRIYMALAQEDRHPITDIMRQTPDIPAAAQWAIFLRNHDELTLEMVTDRERDYLWNFYARDPRARINLGIRRRLSPLMEHDRKRIDLLNSLLLSMPGTPVLYYGDEIGMGDNVYLGDRDGVRTPMQWAPDRNGGFSSADPARLYLPPIMDPVYGFQAVNVEAQARLSTSLLNQMRRILSIRSSRKAFGRGTVKFLYPRNRKILSYVRQYESEIILCVANLSRGSQAVQLELAEHKGRVPVDLFDRSQFPAVTDRPYLLTLPGHSFFWFTLLEPAQLDGGLASAPPEAMPEMVTLVIRSDWSDLRSGRAATELARDVLPLFLPTQRWFSAKDRAIRDVQVENAATLPVPAGGQGDGWRLLLLKVGFTDGHEQHYFLPLGLTWGAPTTEPIAQLMPQTLAHVRRFRAEGALFDAAGQESFILAALRAVGEGRALAAENGGKVEFRAEAAFAGLALPENPSVRRLGGEQSNTSVLVDDAAIFKSYRQVHAGIHPEVEMMAYLTAKAPEVSIPPLLGTVTWTLPHGEPMAAGLLMAFVRNQGDAWVYTREHLKRSFQDSLHAPPPAPGDPPGRNGLHHALYLEIAGQLGRRTAELHRALCRPDENDPAFAPEPITAADLEAWLQTILVQAEVVFNDLRPWMDAHAEADPSTLADIRRLLELAPELRSRAKRVTIERIEAVKTRYHGDLHLGQVLVKQNDVVLIDFEGEPRRSLEERRSKHSALKDVAGVLRSFDYAAAAAGRTVAELPAVQLTDFQKFCAEWRVLAERKFLERYRETIDGCPVWPRSAQAAEDLLNLLILDKAIYEIGYEIANRPNWVGIPVRAVVEMLEAAGPRG
ncbi:MAG TPA: maltose alpha-D-glucosyltransferase [Opitutaceae bacterium]|nr:maltose alpha-D-glucosyltransferase [Opitutaceae bacterium]